MPIINRRPPVPRSCDPGIVWPVSGTDAVATLGDIFGDRTFSGGTGHATGRDFHRGIDLVDNIDGAGEPAGKGGVPILSPIHGRVIRKFYGFFQFDDAANMSELAETDAGSKATFSQGSSKLTIVGKNDGTVTFPSGLARLEKIKPFQMDITGNDWVMDFQLASSISTTTGKLVMGIYDSVNAQWLCLEYDGATYTCKGVKATGTMTNNNATASVSGKLWGRIYFEASSGKVYWQYSTDGLTWTDIVSGGEAFTVTNRGGFKAFIGWDPAASGGDDTVNVEMWGSGDTSSVNRFGNWIEIANATSKFCMMHFRHISVNLGDEVRPGQQVALTGQTGFDIRSGRILSNHCHIEYHPTNAHDYSNADPVNPLSALILPRASTTVSIGVVRDSATDPNAGGNDCHRLTITIDRGTYQNFQINSFSLTGNTTVRTVNWNTRAGLDPADQDTNYYDGVYFQPVAFDETSSQYVFKIYFKKSTVGSTFVSAYVKDPEGNTLWSE